MATKEHRGKSVESVQCAALTVSDSRTPENDHSGALIWQRLEASGHRLTAYVIVPDEPGEIRDRVLAFCRDPDAEVVILTGGTGLAARDTTYEVLAGILDKRLEGFGELFRMLSYEQVGSAAMLSRALAGVRSSTVVFSLPGSTAAVELALDKLILPEMGHIAALLRD